MGKQSIELVVGVFVLVCLLCVAYLTVKVGRMDVLGGDTYQVSARFQSVEGLKTGADVQIAGVGVGKVSNVIIDPLDLVAVVTLQVDKGIELTEDTIASVRTAGLIGDKYIKLTPGGADEVLQDGDQIEETESAIDIMELISKYAFGSV
ncbi:phospholipid/cholesterol/gamma-HCH transport system substrate-binding protein [Desulfatibacillum alkenivorans DSM 16219]|jgi:phospholipid/cholesterol/gamma-HCH transport system substrate-binding protein|uniref:Phospholipid/cholesterol/gamma-HCH transport system substrate-binding protein n=1 Tax=Desulfatibacillum alkenivorans DSM 16219 TaxID=1121393 RepID=A0A1M6RPG7_9BACT|nr:outer membrane lipid asymmetry maintenance protein MlaD [Desulfatibacillum alkenivorans]SHK34324.1 phospholipid/cholesterol/gamma-HCH transport system substrate-binding protein [Desulfatibacillum alkenivorans DSM 16219]